MSGRNEGEGNRSAARAYDKHVRETVRDKDVHGLAEKARKDVENDRGGDLKDAEKVGKKPAGG
ncbi:MAG: hypothetical protein CMM50_02165 [Rhodospirillaceae bacterium]|nr:hypothetical protein [Rhodospirillaceae bacterium]|tara:strand:+ start:413 stop:601 length:189 start_codon:yes stop_codon:yes gene_type:complete